MGCLGGHRCISSCLQGSILTLTLGKGGNWGDPRLSLPPVQAQRRLAGGLSLAFILHLLCLQLLIFLVWVAPDVPPHSSYFRTRAPA